MCPFLDICVVVRSWVAKAVNKIPATTARLQLFHNKIPISKSSHFYLIDPSEYETLTDALKKNREAEENMIWKQINGRVRHGMVKLEEIKKV